MQSNAMRYNTKTLVLIPNIHNRPVGASLHYFLYIFDHFACRLIVCLTRVRPCSDPTVRGQIPDLNLEFMNIMHSSDWRFFHHFCRQKCHFHYSRNIFIAITVLITAFYFYAQDLSMECLLAMSVSPSTSTSKFQSRIQGPHDCYRVVS